MIGFAFTGVSRYTAPFVFMKGPVHGRQSADKGSIWLIELLLVVI